MAIREIIKPDSETYTLHIPKNYVHQEIEVILLPVLSLNRKTALHQVTESFEPALYHGAGKVSKKDIDDYLESAKNEWQF